MLKGGLGNQLFQFGAALRLARGDISLIKLYLGHLGHNTFKLSEIFHTHGLPQILSAEELNSIVSMGESKAIGDVDDNPYINQRLLDLNIDLKGVHIFLNGYFQTGHSLSALSRHLSTMGGIENCPLSQRYQAVSNKKLTAHIRLGDYRRPDVQNQIGVINFGYFDRVISREIAAGKTVQIYSDESDAIRKIFSTPAVEVSSETDDLLVFNNLLYAERLLIPNSTFSLCAAYLSPALIELIRPARWTKKIIGDELLWGFKKQVKIIPNAFF